MLSEVFSRLWLWVLVVLALLMGGCVGTIGLRGGGEFGIGIRADNMLVVYSKVDGDKVGKEAEVNAKIGTMPPREEASRDGEDDGEDDAE